MTNIIAAMIIAAGVITAAVVNNWDEVRPLNHVEISRIEKIAGNCQAIIIEQKGLKFKLRGRLMDAVSDYCKERL